MYVFIRQDNYSTFFRVCQQFVQILVCGKIFILIIRILRTSAGDRFYRPDHARKLLAGHRILQPFYNQNFADHSTSRLRRFAQDDRKFLFWGSFWSGRGCRGRANPFPKRFALPLQSIQKSITVLRLRLLQTFLQRETRRR